MMSPLAALLCVSFFTPSGWLERLEESDPPGQKVSRRGKQRNISQQFPSTRVVSDLALLDTPFVQLHSLTLPPHPLYAPLATVAPSRLSSVFCYFHQALRDVRNCS